VPAQWHHVILDTLIVLVTYVGIGISRRVDGWAVSACEFSCVSIVRWRQHMLVHRWCSSETVKWCRRQLFFFLSSAADQRCVDIQNWILPSRRSVSVSTASDLGRLFPRLLDQYCIAEGFSLKNLCTVLLDDHRLCCQRTADCRRWHRKSCIRHANQNDVQTYLLTYLLIVQVHYNMTWSVAWFLCDGRASGMIINVWMRMWTDLHQTVVGVGNVVRAADRCECRRAVAAAATLHVTCGRKDHALTPERTEHRLTWICSK